jgi:hypothetical protein
MTVDSTPTDTGWPLDATVRRRAEAEYREMPGLKLTTQQAARLWQLDTAATARLLDAMVAAGVLCRARDGAYISR